MAQVRFTNHLKRFFPTLTNSEVVTGQTVAEIVTALDVRYPGLGNYIVDERGALRRHVNIFLGDTLISDKLHLQDTVGSDTTIFIMQALSGG